MRVVDGNKGRILSRDKKMQGKNRTFWGGGRRDLLRDPVSELRQGRREKRRARIIHGMEKNLLNYIYNQKGKLCTTSDPRMHPLSFGGSSVGGPGKAMRNELQPHYLPEWHGSEVTCNSYSPR